MYRKVSVVARFGDALHGESGYTSGLLRIAVKGIIGTSEKFHVDVQEDERRLRNQSRHHRVFERSFRCIRA